MISNKRAQNVSEYAIVIGVISSLLLAINLYIQRGVQVVIKEPVDNLGMFGFIPDYIENMTFGPGLSVSEVTARKSELRAQRIQEIGIEDNVDEEFGPPIPSMSLSNFDNTNLTRNWTKGRHFSRIDENTRVMIRNNEAFQKMEYDQVTRPNTPEHSY
ncbi:hypothetical protein ACFL1D_00040 [Candidatus Omnitrophota bacterium]